jgi:hypothetical protein
VMTLNKRTLLELEALAANLRHSIARNPRHSRIKQLQLDRVQQVMFSRHRQLRHIFAGPSDDPTDPAR